MRLPLPPLLAPLRGRNYALLWGGNTASLVGDQFQTVALAVLVLDLTGSAAALGAVLGAQAAPRAVLLLAGGVAADRFRPRTVMLAANALQGVLVLALTAVLATGRLALWQLFAYAVGSGAALAFSIPAARALIPALVPTERLRSANALNALSTNLAGAVFAPLAGAVVARVGSLPAFALNAASFFAAAGTVQAIRVPGAAPGRPDGSPLRQLREGVAAAHADRVVWVAILATAIFSLGIGGATRVGLPALATLALDGGTQGIGVLYGAIGAGAVLGNVLTGSLTRLPRQGLVAGATLLAWGLTLALAGAAPSVAAAVPVLACVGLLQGVCGNTFVSLVQGRAPAAAQGRVMSLLFLGVNGLGPVSLAAGGLLGAAVGPRALIVGGGVVVALAGAYALAQREFREAP